MIKIMDINIYQQMAETTAVYKHTEYPIILLAEEAGEVLGKLNKYARKNGVGIAEAVRVARTAEDETLREDIIKELGDVAWGLVLACKELNVDPAFVLGTNIEKLQDRKNRGVLNGAGDNR